MSSFFFLQANPGINTGAAKPATGVKDVPIWDIIDQSNQGIGWIINLILLIMFGYTIFVFVERFLALRKATKEEQGFLNNVKSQISSGNLQGAKDICKKQILTTILIQKEKHGKQSSIFIDFDIRMPSHFLK